MSVSEIPLVSMLRTRMQWHQARQKVLAENVANADTPGFRPRDLKGPRFNAAGALVPAGVQDGVAAGKAVSMGTPDAGAGFGGERTSPLHFAIAMGGGTGEERRNASRFEILPSGNAISLEDEMMKSGENQSDYQLAASLYQKSLQMLKLAVGKG